MRTTFLSWQTVSRSGMLVAMPVNYHDERGRVCVSCLTYLSWQQFRTDKTHPTHRKDTCKPCSVKASALVNQVRPYGIDVETYLLLFHMQSGVCAICSSPPPRSRPLYIDHCHATGRVRGLLCPSCNTRLGKAQDDPERFPEAAAYLSETSTLALIARR